MCHHWKRWQGMEVKMTHRKYEHVPGTRTVENCGICDDFTECDEFNRLDGLVVFLCLACQDDLEAKNRIVSNHVY